MGPSTLPGARAWGGVRPHRRRPPPSPPRGAQGREEQEEQEQQENVINDELFRYEEKTKMSELPTNQGLTCNLS